MLREKNYTQPVQTLNNPQKELETTFRHNGKLHDNYPSDSLNAMRSTQSSAARTHSREPLSAHSGSLPSCGDQGKR